MTTDVWRDAYGDTVELTLRPSVGTVTISSPDSGLGDIVIHTTRPITFVEKGLRRPSLLRRLWWRLPRRLR